MWYNHQYSHHSMAFPLDIWGSSLFQKSKYTQLFVQAEL